MGFLYSGSISILVSWWFWKRQVYLFKAKKFSTKGFIGEFKK
jgi:hypothetical protein